MGLASITARLQMAHPPDQITDRTLYSHAQSVPTGDTGDRDTGVPDDQQGISNRPGDSDDELDEDDEFDADENEDELEGDDPENEV
jgi:hypothetical protein